MEAQLHKTFSYNARNLSWNQISHKRLISCETQTKLDMTVCQLLNRPGFLKINSDLDNSPKIPVNVYRLILRDRRNSQPGNIFRTNQRYILHAIF